MQDEMTTCPSCKKDLPSSDFILSKTCFRCVYAEKVKDGKAVSKEIPIKGCSVCNKKLKRNRRKYCSEECAFIAKIKKDKNIWHKNLNVQRSRFKV